MGLEGSKALRQMGLGRTYIGFGARCFYKITRMQIAERQLLNCSFLQCQQQPWLPVGQTGG